MPAKQISFRRLPGDVYFLDLIGEEWGIDNTAVFRMALREFAYRHGFAHRDMFEMLLTLRDVVTGCRVSKVQGMDKILSRAEKLLSRNESRLQKAYKFEPYPKDVEREIHREELIGRAKKTRSG